MKIQRKVVKTEQGQDDQELQFAKIVEDLKSLIIYAKAVSIKPWDWDEQRATTVTQMFSFGEPRAVELCKTSTKGKYSTCIMKLTSFNQHVISDSFCFRYACLH